MLNIKVFTNRKILRQVDVFNLDDSCWLHQAYTRLRGHVVEMRLYDYNLSYHIKLG